MNAFDLWLCANQDNYREKTLLRAINVDTRYLV